MGCVCSKTKDSTLTKFGKDVGEESKHLSSHIIRPINSSVKLYEDEPLFSDINFATADESESAEDLIYKEAMESLMRADDAYQKSRNEEEESFISG